MKKGGLKSIIIEDENEEEKTIVEIVQEQKPKKGIIKMLSWEEQEKTVVSQEPKKMEMNKKLVSWEMRKKQIREEFVGEIKNVYDGHDEIPFNQKMVSPII